MADIPMCKQARCPLAENCYRFKAKPHPYRQAYTDWEWDTDYEGLVICVGFEPLRWDEVSGLPAPSEGKKQ